MLIYPRFQPGQVPLQRMPLERFGRVKGLARGVGPEAELHNLTEAEVERPFPNQERPFPKSLLKQPRQDSCSERIQSAIQVKLTQYLCILR